jgi:hypothetical protein
VYANSGVSFADAGRGTIQSNNLVATNPLFTNPGAADFSLRNGSPAIDKGTTVTSVRTDIAGVSRPKGSAFDIGAYEFGSAAAPPTPTGLRIIRQ